MITCEWEFELCVSLVCGVCVLSFGVTCTCKCVTCNVGAVAVGHCSCSLLVLASCFFSCSWPSFFILWGQICFVYRSLDELMALDFCPRNCYCVIVIAVICHWLNLCHLNLSSSFLISRATPMHSRSRPLGATEAGGGVFHGRDIGHYSLNSYGHRSSVIVRARRIEHRGLLRMCESERREITSAPEINSGLAHGGGERNSSQRREESAATARPATRARSTNTNSERQDRRLTEAAPPLPPRATRGARVQPYNSVPPSPPVHAQPTRRLPASRQPSSRQPRARLAPSSLLADFLRERREL